LDAILNISESTRGIHGDFSMSFLKEVKVLHIDRMQFKIRSIGWGEEFSLSKHPQGTEVKAITYSAMQIHDTEKPEIFAIIDI